jgi:hypothetical protein
MVQQRRKTVGKNTFARFDKKVSIFISKSDYDNQNVEARPIMTEAIDAPELPLTKRYLQILAATFAGRYDVKVSEGAGAGLWTVSVTWPDTADATHVKTERGGTKTWRDVKGALSFVQENCASAKKVTLQVGEWQLLRQQQPC